MFAPQPRLNAAPWRGATSTAWQPSANGSKFSSNGSSSLASSSGPALPNAPKVGSKGSLSPRSDCRALSDAKADVWIDELKQDVPL